jgi:predicted amidohydrolase YtcJ
MKAIRLFASLLLACVMSTPLSAARGTTTLGADLVVINANVRTMDAQRPTAEAVAVVGTSEEIKRLAGARTRVIDAGGALVLPGFNDAHVHFLSGGFQLASVDLRDAATPREFAERIRRFVEGLPKGRWVTGGDWDHERWPEVNGAAPLPTKELLDAFTPDTPVFVNRLDGHMALANSLALRLAAVTRRTLDGKNPGGWVPEQKVTVEEAVRAYTTGSAYAEFTDHVKGSLAPGRLADLVILSRDIFRIDPAEIEKTRVRLTMVDGRVVYEAEKGKD